MAGNFDLRTRAYQAMVERGFHPDFPAAVTAELHALPNVGKTSGTLHDLRSLLWSSIDNENSRDLDQVEYAEKLPDGTIRLLIGIADVDSLVARGSATDRHA